MKMASSTPCWSRARGFLFAAYQMHSMLLHTGPAPHSLARKSLFSIWVDGVVLSPHTQALRSRRLVVVPSASRLQRFHNASGWSSVAHWSWFVGSWVGWSEILGRVCVIVNNVTIIQCFQCGWNERTKTKRPLSQYSNHYTYIRYNFFKSFIRNYYYIKKN